MKTIAVIPARLGSTRLPRKVLADIGGKPLIRYVWERVSQARNIDAAFIATDSMEVVDVVASWGGKSSLTDPECQSGTERIASIVSNLDVDLVLNVQGDEPLIDPGMLDALVSTWRASPCDLITPVFRIRDLQDLTNPTIVKVARAQSGQALYFSRSAIPYMRDWPLETWLDRHPYWGHIGVYGYRREVLAAYASLPASPLQQTESLEQLRFLEAGYIFQTMETTYRSVAVDTQEDLDKVRKIICK